MQTAVKGIHRGLAGELGSRGWTCRATAARRLGRADLALMFCLCATALFMVLFTAGCGALGDTLLSAAAPQSGEPGPQLGPSPTVGEQAEPSLDGESGSDSSTGPEIQPEGEDGSDAEGDSDANSGDQTGADPGADTGVDQAADGGTEPGTESVTDPGADDPDPDPEPGPDPDPEPESTPLEQARSTCEQLGLSQGAIDATFTFAQAAVDSGFAGLQTIEFVRTPCVAACANSLTICELTCTDCAIVVISAVSNE